MAALAAPMRQIIKEETTLILHTAAESVSTSSTTSAAGVGMAVREAVVKEAGAGVGAVRAAGIGAVREAAVKESPLAVSRVGGVVAEEGLAGGRTNVAQHLEILNNNLKSTVHPPTGTANPISTTTSSATTSSLHAVNPPPIPPIPNAHLHPNAAIPPSTSTILESLSSSLSSTARTSAEKSGSKVFSLEGGLKEAVENALQTGVQEQVEVVVDTAEVSNLNLNLNLGEVKI